MRPTSKMQALAVLTVLLSIGATNAIAEDVPASTLTMPALTQFAVIPHEPGNVTENREELTSHAADIKNSNLNLFRFARHGGVSPPLTLQNGPSIIRVAIVDEPVKHITATLSEVRR